jgi:Spy/CpxP family protein refolding chaperone
MKRFSTFKMAAALVFALAMFGSVAMAQSTAEPAAPVAGDPGGHGGFGRGHFGGEMMGLRMLSKVTPAVTEAQKTQIKTITQTHMTAMKTYGAQLRALRAQSKPADGTTATFDEATETKINLASAPILAKMKGERIAMHNELMGVLTADQQTSLKALQQQAKADFAAKRAAWQAAHPRTATSPTQDQQ